MKDLTSNFNYASGFPNLRNADGENEIDILLKDGEGKLSFKYDEVNAVNDLPTIKGVK